MPLSAQELNEAVEQTISAASAPLGSAMHDSVESIIRERVVDRDGSELVDGVAFVHALCESILVAFGLDKPLACPHGDQDHLTTACYMIIPAAPDGSPDESRAYTGDPTQPVPEDLYRDRPDVVLFCRLMWYQMNRHTFGIDNASMAQVAIWTEIAEIGVVRPVMLTAAHEAGKVRRQSLGHNRVN